MIKTATVRAAQLQGFSEEVLRKDFMHAPGTPQGGDTKTGPQTSRGTAERQPCGRAEQRKKSRYAPEDSV